MHITQLNAKNRERWVARILAAIPKGKRILDAGAGEQQYRRFCKHLRYVSQDFCEYDGQGNQAGLQMKTWDVSEIDIVSDITTIPEPDKSFDAILCTEVLEHILDPLLAIKEFSRLLKPKGKLILTAPFGSLTHFAPYHFSTGFNRYFYETALSRYGFTILSLTPNGNYFDFLHQELCRLPRVASEYARNRSLTWIYPLFEKFLINPLFTQLSKRGKVSAELSCFGYHVLAEKKAV